MMLDKEEINKITEGIAKEITEETTKETTKEPAIETAEDTIGNADVQTVEKTAQDTIKEAQEPAAAEVKKTGYRSEINGVEVDFELQYRDRETDMKDIANRVTEDYVKRGNAADKIESIHVYLKPTDFTAYYVINDVYEGKIPLF